MVRTVFAVGDEKQSIFSFQGAAPARIRRCAAGRLKKKFEDAGLKFDPVSFTYSFRSGPAILQSVDHVFREQDIYRSIHAVENAYPIHHALRDAGPSLIDLWELAEADDRQDIEGWRAPFDGVAATSPRGEAFEAHPGRDQVAGRQRHHDRQHGQAAAAALWRHAGAGAAARQRCSTP